MSLRVLAHPAGPLLDPERWQLAPLCDVCGKPIDGDARVVWRAGDGWSETGAYPDLCHAACLDALLRSRFTWKAAR